MGGDEVRITFDGLRGRGAAMGWRRQQVVRSGLVAGVLLLALVLLLSMCGTSSPGGGAADDHDSRPRAHFVVPAGYDTSRGWDVRGVAEPLAVAPATGSVAALEDVGGGRHRLRALDVTTGRTRWTGPARKSGAGSWTSPRLLEVDGHGREFFVVWSYGDAGSSTPDGTGKVVALDVYDAAYGTLRHQEVPWDQPPDVAGGPGVLIGRGADHAAVVDPADGTVTRTAAKDLKYPKGCAPCRRDTEISGLTTHGLVVRGARQFWVRGGWYGRRTAPKGTDPGSGVPTAVSGDRVLVRWYKKPGDRHADDLETWAVHDAATGRVLASADCHRPGIEPGRYPEMTFSFSGRYMVAGPLAVDLEEHRAHCYDESDHPAAAVPGDAGAPDPQDPAADHGPRPLVLTAVTDDGTAYGTTAVQGAAGGRPIEVTLAPATARALRPTAHLPAVDVGGYGIFPYTDGADVRHLVGHPHRTTPQ